MDASSVADETRQELLEKYHDINVDHDWWDCVYEQFKEDMHEKGIEVVTPYFSGFWSQGDGACFEGVVPVSRVTDFLREHELDERYPSAVFFADNADLRIESYKITHHYCHENTVSVRVNDFIANPYDEGSTRYELYEAMQEQFELDFAEFKLDCEDILKSYMRDLYRRLYKEYEYLTSEEAVWDTIVANDLHKQVA